MITYWIYTKQGVKVGEFSVDANAVATAQAMGMSEDTFLTARFRIACLALNIDPKKHNKCIAAA